jgi:hypothetical protein
MLSFGTNDLNCIDSPVIHNVLLLIKEIKEIFKNNFKLNDTNFLIKYLHLDGIYRYLLEYEGSHTFSFYSDFMIFLNHFMSKCSQNQRFTKVLFIQIRILHYFHSKRSEKIRHCLFYSEMNPKEESNKPIMYTFL